MKHLENTLTTQLYSLLIFTISGMVIGVFFDLFRILRKSFKTPDIVTYIEDILFWICTGGFLLYILFTFQNGEIRSYVILGLLSGILIYILTISHYFVKVNVTILTFCKTILAKILKIVFYPFSILFRFFKKVIGKPFSFLVINICKLSTNFNKKITEKVKKKKKTKKVKENVKKKKEFHKKCRKI